MFLRQLVTAFLTRIANAKLVNLSFQEPSEPSEPLRVTSVKATWQHCRENRASSIDHHWSFVTLGIFRALGHWVFGTPIAYSGSQHTTNGSIVFFIAISLPFLDQVEGKATIQRIELSYSDGSIWAMGPPVARAKKAAKAKNRKDDGVRVMAALLQLILFYRLVQYEATSRVSAREFCDMRNCQVELRDGINLIFEC